MGPIDPARCLVIIPATGPIRADTLVRLQRIRDATPGLPPIRVERFAFSRGLLLTAIVRQFLATPAEVLLLVAPDVVPPLGLLEVATQGPEIVAAPCLMPLPGTRTPVLGVFTLQADGWPPQYRVLAPEARQGLVACDAVSVRCVAIARCVLAHPEMARPFPVWLDADGVEDRPPEWLFCWRARRCGFRIAADFDHPASSCA